jgi:hypothetical protein
LESDEAPKKPKKTTNNDEKNIIKVLEKKYKVPELKTFLKNNSQKSSGSKSELCERLADCFLNGCLPHCPKVNLIINKCGGAVLTYNDGLFKCPGYFDDDHFKRVSFF